jgi:hypothetical protein
MKLTDIVLIPIALILSVLPGARPVGVIGAQEPRQRLTLGVLRSDGVLLPFAAYDDGKWSTPWPHAVGIPEGGLVDLPANLGAVPDRWYGKEVPSTWRLWARGADAPVTLAPVAPVLLRLGIARRLGLRTDYKVPPARLPPPFVLPFPKEGLAVGGDVPVQGIPTVSRNAPEWKQFPEKLRADLDKAEERAIRALRSGAGWKHPFNASIRNEAPITLEAWYTSELPEPGHAVSYIEAVKEYPLVAEDEGCGLQTFFSGWVHHDARDTRVNTAFKAVVAYCDREKASYMLPLGRVMLKNRMHWIFQMSGHDHEWYAVAEITPGRVRYVAEYLAGNIPTRMTRR